MPLPVRGRSRGFPVRVDDNEDTTFQARTLVDRWHARTLSRHPARVGVQAGKPAPLRRSNGHAGAFSTADEDEWNA